MTSQVTVIQWDGMDKRDQAFPDLGGRDGLEGLSIFQTWDCWDIPWDPKAPWDYRTGWTRGTKHTPDLGLLRYPMGFQGTIGL